MKEMWTGIFPKRKDYNYEIRFRTDNKYAYKLVQEACREAIDTDCANESPAPDKEAADEFRWLRVDNTVYDINKINIIKHDCKCGYITHNFDTREMIGSWNTAGIITCSECGRKITYEFLK